MIRSLSIASVMVLAGWSCWGQPAAVSAFEVASVKMAAPCCAPGQWRESKAGADRIDFPNVTLRYCIAFAYGVKEYQVSGPSWLAEQRFDIVAKGPAGTRREQLPEMMQALLAQRLQVQVHTETKEFSVYALTVGKNGPKLKEAPAQSGDDAAGAKFGISMTGAGVGRLEGRSATMLSLANTLVRIMGRPVVDMTGVAGRYDLELEFSTEDANGMRTATPPAGAVPAAAEPGASIFGSIQQLGLKLDVRKVPQTAIVVDRAEKVPSEN